MQSQGQLNSLGEEPNGGSAIAIFSRTRWIARDGIKDVLILANHRTGYDVMLSHAGRLTVLASIYGDLTRPTLFRLLLEQAMAETAESDAVAPDPNLQGHNLRMYT